MKHFLGVDIRRDGVTQNNMHNADAVAVDASAGAASTGSGSVTSLSEDEEARERKRKDRAEKRKFSADYRKENPCDARVLDTVLKKMDRLEKLIDGGGIADKS